NIACLSRIGHIAKTHGGWTCAGDANGVLTWTSPHGAEFPSTPPRLRRRTRTTTRPRPTTVLNRRDPTAADSNRRQLVAGTARSACPMYLLSGRISELAPCCSMMCAVQPVIRLRTNSGVNIGMSKPIR
ncbi:MAG: hypothetical protein QOE76_33, partial [Frankiales bacterium]|nr:hypothetical protein [Frankiales bacterium]